MQPDIVEYDKNNKPQYDLILSVKTMKKYGIILDFKDKMITIDEVKLPMQNINYVQGSSTLRVLRLNHSLAMEPQSTQDTTKHVMQILDAKYQKADLQSIVRDNCKHLSVISKRSYCSYSRNISCSLMAPQVTGRPSRSHSNKRREYHPTMAKLSQCQKSTRHHHERGGEIVQTGGIREAACI